MNFVGKNTVSLNYHLHSRNNISIPNCLQCGHLTVNLSHLASPTLSDVDNEEETKLLQSEIWTTLFRGGYMTGKLQRSLSGHHVSHFQFIYCSLYFYNP